MNKTERKNRVIARGEGSNHAHVVTGDATITRNENGEIIVELGNEECVLKHILESAWMNGQETWTQEHGDIDLKKIDNRAKIGESVRHGDVLLEKIADRKYKYIPQVEFDPYNEVIRQVQD